MKLYLCKAKWVIKKTYIIICVGLLNTFFLIGCRFYVIFTTCLSKINNHERMRPYKRGRGGPTCCENTSFLKAGDKLYLINDYLSCEVNRWYQYLLVSTN